MKKEDWNKELLKTIRFYFKEIERLEKKIQRNKKTIDFLLTQQISNETNETKKI